MEGFLKWLFSSVIAIIFLLLTLGLTWLIYNFGGYDFWHTLLILVIIENYTSHMIFRIDNELLA